MSFAAEVFTHDLVVPAHGSRRLADYYAEMADGLGREGG
jgi:hypothetical protein